MTASTICLSLIALMAAAQPDDKQLVQAIRIAYRSNRDALKYGTIRFTLNVGEAADPKNAASGRLNRQFTATGLYAFEGPVARYECLFPVEDEVSARVKAGENSWTSVIDSHRFLTNGKVALYDGLSVQADGKSVSHTAQINPASDTIYMGVKIPLDLGIPRPRGHNPDKDITALESGKADWELAAVDADAILGGLHTVRLTFRSASEEVQYWIDLEHGAIPRQTILTAKTASGEDGTTIQWNSDDVRFVADRAWLPFRQTSFVTPNRARRLTVISADFEKPPAPSVYQMEFPEAKPMLNAVALVKYPPRKIWDLDHLPSRGRGTKTITIAEPEALPPAMPGPREGRSWVRLTLSLMGVALLIAAAVFTIRRRNA